MSYFVGKKDTDMWFPVRLVDSVDSKTPETGKATGDITVVYGVEAATGETGYAQGADFWKEQGSGNYWLSIGASEFTAAAKYIVNIECAGCDPVNFAVDCRPPETNMVEIGGNSIAGNLATLTLKQLSIINSAGHGIIAGSTNAGSDGINAYGNTTGDGLHLVGGATGHGIETKGGATSGAGIYAAAQNNNDAGMELVKHGTGADLDADEISTIDTVVDGIQTDLSNGTDGLGALKDLIDTVDGVVDAILTDTGTDGVVVKAAGLAADAANEIADALLDRANGVETSYTPRQALRLILSALAGKLSGASTTEVTIRDVGDGTDRIVATVDASGNRSALTLDPD